MRLTTICMTWLLGLAMAGCASEEAPFHFPESETKHYKNLLAGKWLGEKSHADGTYQRWLVHRHDDGTYRVDFELTYIGGGISVWSEQGIWGVRKPIYFTAARSISRGDGFKPFDVTRHALYDAYLIQTLDESSFAYLSYTSGNDFELRKVEDDFEL